MAFPCPRTFMKSGSHNVCQNNAILKNLQAPQSLCGSQRVLALYAQLTASPCLDQAFLGFLWSHSFLDFTLSGHDLSWLAASPLHICKVLGVSRVELRTLGIPCRMPFPWVSIPWLHRPCWSLCLWNVSEASHALAQPVLSYTILGARFQWGPNRHFLSRFHGQLFIIPYV